MRKQNEGFRINDLQNYTTYIRQQPFLQLSIPLKRKKECKLFHHKFLSAIYTSIALDDLWLETTKMINEQKDKLDEIDDGLEDTFTGGSANKR